MHGWMHGCMDARMHGCMDGWMDGWMDGCMDGWMDGWMQLTDSSIDKLLTDIQVLISRYNCLTAVIDGLANGLMLLLYLN